MCWQRRVKIVSHSSCRTSAILKYFCPLCLHGIKKKYHNFPHQTNMLSRATREMSQSRYKNNYYSADNFPVLFFCEKHIMPINKARFFLLVDLRKKKFRSRVRGDEKNK